MQVPRFPPAQPTGMQPARRAVGPAEGRPARGCCRRRGFVGREAERTLEGRLGLGHRWGRPRGARGGSHDMRHQVGARLESGGLSPRAGKGCSHPPPMPLELSAPSLLLVLPPPLQLHPPPGLRPATEGDSAAPRTGQALLELRPRRPRQPTRPGLSGRGACQCQWPVGSRGGISSPTARLAPG